MKKTTTTTTKRKLLTNSNWKVGQHIQTLYETHNKRNDKRLTKQLLRMQNNSKHSIKVDACSVARDDWSVKTPFTKNSTKKLF